VSHVKNIYSFYIKKIFKKFLIFEIFTRFVSKIRFFVTYGCGLKFLDLCISRTAGDEGCLVSLCFHRRLKITPLLFPDVLLEQNTWSLTVIFANIKISSKVINKNVFERGQNLLSNGILTFA